MFYLCVRLEWHVINKLHNMGWFSTQPQTTEKSVHCIEKIRHKNYDTTMAELLKNVAKHLKVNIGTKNFETHTESI